MKTLNTSCPVEYISGVWKFIRPPRKNEKAHSTPDHLLHMIIQGSYKLKSNQRVYDVKQGDIIYYYGSEDVEWLESSETVIFYSVAFKSSFLQPLQFEKRVFKASASAKKAFAKLYEYSLDSDQFSKNFGMYRELLTLIMAIQQENKCAQVISGETDIWQKTEDLLRIEKLFRPDLEGLCRMSGKSRASLIRLCRKVTGKTPMKRVQEIRMTEAAGLLNYSTLNVSQISEYLGYPRIHEFSREFRKYFGFPPSDILKN